MFKKKTFLKQSWEPWALTEPLSFVLLANMWAWMGYKDEAIPPFSFPCRRENTQRRRLWGEVGVRGRGGDLLRDQDRPEAEPGHDCGPTPPPPPGPAFSPSLEDMLGDADIPVWTLAQSSVAMATQWALWWVEEGSRCVVISTGDSSSALSLRQSRRFWVMGSRSLCLLRKPQEAPKTSGLSLLAPIYTCLTGRNQAPVWRESSLGTPPLECVHRPHILLEISSSFSWLIRPSMFVHSFNRYIFCAYCARGRGQHSEQDIAPALRELTVFWGEDSNKWVQRGLEGGKRARWYRAVGGGQLS